MVQAVADVSAYPGSVLQRYRFLTLASQPVSSEGIRKAATASATHGADRFWTVISSDLSVPDGLCDVTFVDSNQA